MVTLLSRIVRLATAIACLAFAFVSDWKATAAPPLTALEYKVVGVSLNVTPPVLSVPKGIAGSISAKLSGGAAPPAGWFLEATLRGPSFPARRLVGAVGSAFLLPPLPLVGDYQLDAIRLVDDLNGAAILFRRTAGCAPPVSGGISLVVRRQFQ